MNNRLMFQPGASLIGDVLWQSGLFLGIGLGSSLALTRRPARRIASWCWRWWVPWLRRYSVRLFNVWVGGS